MNRSYIRIAVILDKSGSMKDYVDSTIHSFNNFLNELKADPHGACQLKLIQFNTEYSITFDKHLGAVPALTNKLYTPEGGTALLDAQGRTIDELGAELRGQHENERPGKVIVCTISDGLENSSKHYTHGQISEMIEHQQKVYNWEFLYLGANQDAVKVGGSLNIPRIRSMSYNVADPAAMEYTYRSMAQTVNSLRSAGVSGQSTGSIGFSDEDRKQALQGTQAKVETVNQVNTPTTPNPEEPAISSR